MLLFTRAIYSISFYPVHHSCLSRKETAVEKKKRHTKWQKSQSEEMEQASELNMAGMLELSDQESKAVNIVRVLMDKVDSREEQMDNVSREMQILRKN